MKIAIEGCAHGELEKIYDTIGLIEERESYKVDLLICCGDFQSTRNLDDLHCMAVPKKFHDMCSFYKYYSGEKVAPILTIFIGGNHEASNYLQELPYGGWVAPNIYYLGYAGVVNVNGIRIAGISGIYKGFDYFKGHFECSPYDDSTKRSVYHIRQLEVFRLKQLSEKVDICLSHDWPRGVYNYGNSDQLIRFKPHFRDEIANNKLGSPPCEDLLMHLKPSYWFSAHLHCKFAAAISHEGTDKVTKFLALDKCLPKRRFLQIIELDSNVPITDGIQLSYDLEWLTILNTTKSLLSLTATTNYMPGPGSPYRWDFTPTDQEKEDTRQRFKDTFVVPLNFIRTSEPYNESAQSTGYASQPKAQLNPQTTTFCDTLGIDDPVGVLMLMRGEELNHSTYSDNLSSNNLNDSLNESSLTSISSFNTTSELTPQKKRTEFLLPDPHNLSHGNPDELEIDEDDTDFIVEETTEMSSSILNSTVSSSFSHKSISPPPYQQPPTVESKKDCDDVSAMLSEQAKILSPPLVRKAAPEEIDCTTTTEEGNISTGPPKKFKRRNQAIYAANDD